MTTEPKKPTDPMDIATLQSIVTAHGGVIVMLIDLLIESGALNEETVKSRFAKIYEAYADSRPVAAADLQAMIASVRKAPARARNRPRKPE